MKKHTTLSAQAVALMLLMALTLGTGKANDPVAPFVEIGKKYFVSLNAKQPEPVRGMMVEILSSTGGGWFRVKAAWVSVGDSPHRDSKEMWINFSNVVTAYEWKPDAEVTRVE